MMTSRRWRALVGLLVVGLTLSIGSELVGARPKFRLDRLDEFWNVRWNKLRKIREGLPEKPPDILGSKRGPSKVLGLDAIDVPDERLDELLEGVPDASARLLREDPAARRVVGALDDVMTDLPTVPGKRGILSPEEIHSSLGIAKTEGIVLMANLRASQRADAARAYLVVGPDFSTLLRQYGTDASRAADEMGESVRRTVRIGELSGGFDELHRTKVNYDSLVKSAERMGGQDQSKLLRFLNDKRDFIRRHPLAVTAGGVTLGVLLATIVDGREPGGGPTAGEPALDALVGAFAYAAGLPLRAGAVIVEETTEKAEAVVRKTAPVIAWILVLWGALALAILAFRKRKVLWRIFLWPLRKAYGVGAPDSDVHDSSEGAAAIRTPGHLAARNTDEPTVGGEVGGTGDRNHDEQLADVDGTNDSESMHGDKVANDREMPSPQE